MWVRAPDVLSSRCGPPALDLPAVPEQHQMGPEDEMRATAQRSGACTRLPGLPDGRSASACLCLPCIAAGSSLASSSASAWYWYKVA